MKVKLVRSKITPLDDHTKVRPVNSKPGKILALGLKLHEEVQEVLGDPTNPYEYADVLEALICLAETNGLTYDQIEAARFEKGARLGGFHTGMILIQEEDTTDETN